MRAGRPEILAPAGDEAALRAALLAGADAVYVAGRRFGARAFAANFDRDGLWRARRATRRLGRRLYVALNTLVFDREWPGLEAELDFLEELRPDAVIVQDVGVLATLAGRGSAIPRHLSTQGAWDGAGGADVLRGLGVTRVIAPRETPLDDLATLVRDTPFEVETFVHGAHCYSVSGRCWWSVALGPRSGNRGTCAQPCRRSYEHAGETAPHLSPKDLRLVRQLRALAAAGVAALKIEGRLKDAAYVAAVVRTYRAALDAGAAAAGAEAALDGVFGRSSCEGFLAGAPRDWRTGAVVGALGVPVGSVAGPPDAAGRLPVALSAGLRAGEGVAWLDGERRAGDRVTWVSAAGPGRRQVRLRGAAGAPPRGAALYRTAAAPAAAPDAGWDPAWERPALALRFTGAAGAPLVCEFDDGEGRRGRVASAVPLAPAGGEGLAASLAARFGALEGDRYVVALDVAALPPRLFLPPSAVKALRRALVAALGAPPAAAAAASAVAAPGDAPATAAAAPAPREVPGAAPAAGPPPIALRLWQPEALPALRHLRPSGGWVLPAAAGPTVAHGLAGPVAWWLPPVFGPGAAAALDPLLAPLPDATVLCPSWEAFALAPRHPRHRFRLDWTFNVVNERALAVVRAHGLDAVAGCEAPPAFCAAPRVVRLNPLVSLSRFPAGPIGADDVLRSGHGDRYHLVPLAPGVWGLFLLRLPPSAAPLPPAPALQVDVFLPAAPDRAATVAAVEALVAATRAPDGPLPSFL